MRKKPFYEQEDGAEMFDAHEATVKKQKIKKDKSIEKEPKKEKPIEK